MKPQRTYAYINTIERRADEEARVIFSGPGELAIGPPPEFGGRPESLNPEELFVAAINGCLMTTFFYFLQRSGIELQSYQADAEGQVQKGADGFQFVEVKVKATATVDDPSLAEKVSEAARLAEKYCLVSRSVSCPVYYHLQVEISEE
jgi:organic hydroperoxide reductase OsmC/OhrA